MNLKSSPIILLFWFLFAQSVYCQLQNRKIHNITFIATEDSQIGSWLETSSSDIKKWTDDIDLSGSLEVVDNESYKFHGFDFTLENLNTFIDTFRPDPNDAILFWFVGHGLKSDVNTPNVILLPEGTTGRTEKEIEDNSINLVEIYDSIKEKCDFVWFIGSACNADPIKEEAPRSMSYIKPQGIFKGKNENQIIENYENLFLKKNEKHFFYGIKRGDLTYASNTQGAIYIRAFLRVSVREMNNSGIPNTDEFEKLVQREYEILWDQAVLARQKVQKEGDLKEKRPGVFKRLVNFLFEGRAAKKYRKKYKTVLKNGSLEELGNIIPRSGGNGVESPEETAFLKHRPTVYYMTMGIFRESVASNRSDSTFVGECFCTASDVIRNGLSTDKEFRLLKKIDDYNKKNDDPLGIVAAGGRVKYLRKKCDEYKKYLGNQLKSEDRKKEELLAKRKEIEDEIDQLEIAQIRVKGEEEKIKAEREANLLVLKTTEKEWEGENYEISYSITKIFKGSVDQQCLNRTVQKLINEEPLSEDCEKIFAPHIIVKRKRNQDKEINAFRRAQASGYSLGEYCDNGIKNSTKIYLNPLLNDIRKVPSDYRSRLVVNLQITGNADASPCNGGCNFTGLEDMVYSYKNADGEIKSFSTKKGVKTKINNEQLAFARAICAQYEAKELLNKEGVTDIKFEFVVNIADTKGESSRGVKIAFELENQFLHYQDKVEELTQLELQLKKDLDDKKDEMNEIEEKLAEKGEELREINEEILNVEENLFQIKQDLVELESGGLRKNLIKVLRARGMSREEAIQFLN